MKWLGIMLVAAAVAVAPAYGSAATQGQGSPAPQPQANAPEVKQAPAPAASYSPQARKDYEKKADKALTALEQQIHDLAVKVHGAKPQIKRTMLRANLVLEKQAIAARNKLNDLKKASEKDWEALRAEMDQALANLQKSYDETVKHLQ